MIIGTYLCPDIDKSFFAYISLIKNLLFSVLTRGGTYWLVLGLGLVRIRIRIRTTKEAPLTTNMCCKGNNRNSSPVREVRFQYPGYFLGRFKCFHTCIYRVVFKQGNAVETTLFDIVEEQRRFTLVFMTAYLATAPF